MFEITKRPIVIFSSARTGSTVLAQHIERTCNDPELKVFNEPEWQAQQLAEFVNHYHGNQDKNFLLKVHLARLSLYDPDIVEFLTRSPCVFRIKLQRRDMVRQIASYYIARVRNRRWAYFKHELNDGSDSTDLTHDVPIDPGLMQQCTGLVFRQNMAFVNCAVKFDLELWYEDLPDMTHTDHAVTPKPANYTEVIDCARNSADLYQKIIDRCAKYTGSGAPSTS